MMIEDMLDLFAFVVIVAALYVVAVVFY